MTAQGVTWLWTGIVGAAACAALVALSFLKPRTPSKIVPSIMLWLDAATPSQARVLWRRLSRPLSLVCALLALLATLLGAAEPALRHPGAGNQVVVTFPGSSIGEAFDFASSLDPLHTAVLSAESGGILLRRFGEAPLPPPRRKRLHHPDFNSALALAENMAGSGGDIHIFAPEPPPYLPANARYRRTAGGPTPAVPPLKIHPETADAAPPDKLRGLPGIAVSDDAAHAEFSLPVRRLRDRGVFAAAEALDEFGDLLYSTGCYPAPGGQRIVPPDVAAPLNGGARRTAVRLLLTAAFLAAMADLLLWSRGKIA